MQLFAQVIDAQLLARLGNGDEGAFELEAERNYEQLVEIDARGRLAEGTAENALRTWMVEGKGTGRAAVDALELLLAVSRRERLEDNSWSPVRSSTLDELDAALVSAGLQRNSTLRKLARGACGAAGRPLLWDDGLLRVLPGVALTAHEDPWKAAAARMAEEHADRARALLSWWQRTKARGLDAYLHGRDARYDLLLVLT